MTGKRSIAGRILDFAGDFLRFARSRAAIAFGLVLLGAFLESFGIVLLIPLLDLVTGSAGASGSAATSLAASTFDTLGLHGTTARLFGVVAIFALLMILRAIVVAYRQIATTELQLRYLSHKRAEIIGSLSNARWDRISSLRHARITHLLGSDIHYIGSASYGLIAVVVAAVQLGVYFTIAALISLPLTLAAAALLGISAIIARSLFRDAAKSGAAVTIANLNLFNDVAQFLGALKNAISQNLQPAFAAGFSASLDDLIEHQLYLVRRQARMRMRMTIIGIVATVAAVFLGLQVFSLPAALLTTLIVIFSRMAAPFSQMQAQALELVRTLPAYESMRQLKSELDEGGRPPRGPDIAFGPISFQDVTYVHAQQDADLHPRGVRSLSMDITPGTFLGIAGASGGGKTTFLDLLVGLYAPQSGQIAVSGAPAALHLSEAWRDQIAYVSQDSFMLNDTVAANLRWGAASASPTEADAALELAGAKRVIDQMPEGLDTVLGERGALISGGERQRIALARALLRKPKLLILDEATNAIDIPTERQIMSRLKSLTPNLTIVVVAHRAESLAYCDDVVLMQGGRIATRGSYAELLQKMTDAQDRPGFAT